MAVFDHHRVIEHGHIGHAAVTMAMIEIGAKHRILLRRRQARAQFADDVGVARHHPAKVARRPEFIGEHPHGNAGPALVTGRTIGDRLAAAKAAMGQQVVEVAGLVANEMCEHLAFAAAGQIRTRRRRRQIELRGVARVLGHGGLVSLLSLRSRSCRASRPRADRQSVCLDINRFETAEQPARALNC